MNKVAELVALIDMDGTIADFDGQMRKDLAALASPAEQPMANEGEGTDDFDPSWLKARKHLIKSQVGWWEGLPPYAPGMEIAAMLKDAGFSLTVLTKGPYKAYRAWSEKVNWCRRHLPDAGVTITEDKGLVYGKVLVDDWPAYGIRWLEWRPRGLLIVPAHPWNEIDRYPPAIRGNVFRYTGTEDQRQWLADRLQEVKASIFL